MEDSIKKNFFIFLFLFYFPNSKNNFSHPERDRHAVEFSIYSAIAGILINLHDAAGTMSSETKIFPITEALVNVDASFDLKLFSCLTGFAWREAKSILEPAIEEDLAKLNAFMVNLQEISDQKQVRMDAMDEDEDEDNICSICYSNVIDCQFVSCRHRSCTQ